MPELPEVETVVRDLQQKIVGKTIRSLESDVPGLFARTSLENVRKDIQNATVNSVTRHGKNIFINLIKKEKRTVLVVHLKMTGHLLVGTWKKRKGVWISEENDERSHKVNSYIRALITCTDGEMLALCDARKFARIFTTKETAIHPSLQALGPDALDTRRATANHLFESAKKRKIPIKQFLLDQTVIAGIGNIYADEILWEVRLHPRTPAQSIPFKTWEKIQQATRAILQKSIRLRGASMSDYRDTNGKMGSYNNHRTVYQKTGEPCTRCQTPVERCIIAGRSTHFCPTCQN